MMTVKRGTYSAEICIAPSTGHFLGDSTYTISTSGFATYPTTFHAY